MSVRYNEYSQLNLPAIGNEILNKWEAGDTFKKAWRLEKELNLLFFMKDRRVLMECPVFIMLFPEH